MDERSDPIHGCLLRPTLSARPYEATERGASGQVNLCSLFSSYPWFCSWQGHSPRSILCNNGIQTMAGPPILIEGAALVVHTGMHGAKGLRWLPAIGYSERPGHGSLTVAGAESTKVETAITPSRAIAQSLAGTSSGRTRRVMRDFSSGGADDEGEQVHDLARLERLAPDRSIFRHIPQGPSRCQRKGC